MGCDYPGIGEAVGPRVKRPFRKGYQVPGLLHGGNAAPPNRGAFVEYRIAKSDLGIVIPKSPSFQAADTFGVGLTTVGQNLYQNMELRFPGVKKTQTK